MEKTFATCHFSIILISLRVGLMPISDFFSQCQYFKALKSFSTQNHYILYCSEMTYYSSI